MATSQDFVNWICGKQLLPDFLKYLFLAEQKALHRFASGAVHQTIYFPEAKAMHVCIPSINEQIEIVSILDEGFLAIAEATEKVARQLELFGDLRQSILQQSFKGMLTAEAVVQKTLLSESGK